MQLATGRCADPMSGLPAHSTPPTTGDRYVTGMR
jgi:hypothetical protein